MKGLPISYFKDLQDDKALVFDGFDTLKDTLIMSNELIKNIKPNKKRMFEMAKSGYTTATDFADYLVKEKNLSFREAYKISSKIVNYRKNGKNLDELTLNEIKRFYKDLNIKCFKNFDVKNSMNSKNSLVVHLKNVKNMIKKYKKELK